jgi:hypothetical protein
MTNHILAIDQGTTSSRAIVFRSDCTIAAMAQQEFPQHFPRSGWVEHDPEDLWRTVLATSREAIARAGLAARDIAAIGIANQRETTLIWDRADAAARTLRGGASNRHDEVPATCVGRDCATLPMTMPAVMPMIEIWGSAVPIAVIGGSKVKGDASASAIPGVTVIICRIGGGWRVPRVGPVAGVAPIWGGS